MVETALIISLIGIVVVIAVPTFQRALHPSKVSEAGIALQQMVQGAEAYYDAVHELEGEKHVQCLPKNAGPVPAEPDPKGTKVNMAVYPEAAPTFEALGFAPPSPTRYRYSFSSNAQGCELGNKRPAVIAHFVAEGDLDDDDELSRFERIATATHEGLKPDPLLVIEHRVE